MRLVKWIVGGSVGALVGILLWAAVVYLTGYEVGLVAAFVGMFVGIGIAAAAGPDRGTGAAVFAGAFALLAVLGGKAATAWVYSQKYLTDESLAATDITDEYLISCLADDVVAQYEWEGWDLDYPPGADLEFPDSSEDYPPEVWAEAEEQWYGMTDAEQQDYRAVIEAGTEILPFAAFLFAFIISFGLFDLVWIGLAISSAYKIVRDVPQRPGDRTETQVEADAPAAFFPGLPPPTGATPTLHARQHAPHAPGNESPETLGQRKAG